MRPQHQRTVDRLIERFSADPAFDALLIGGSIARGWEREDSDVDIILLAGEQEHARRAPKFDLHFFSRDFSDYPGGYVDGKIVDLAFLEEVAEKGSEPARAAFVGAIVAYSRCPGLAELLARITAYPETERQEKIRTFYTQVQALQWYMGEVERRGDLYLRMRIAADLALFGGRLILAHNRILYPYHKWFTAALSEAGDRPPEFMERLDVLLREPGKPAADAFCECVLGFVDWDKPAEGWPIRFMRDTEWAWRSGRAPLADW